MTLIASTTICDQSFRDSFRFWKLAELILGWERHSRIDPHPRMGTAKMPSPWLANVTDHTSRTNIEETFLLIVFLNPIKGFASFWRCIQNTYNVNHALILRPILGISSWDGGSQLLLWMGDPRMGDPGFCYEFPVCSRCRCIPGLGWGLWDPDTHLRSQGIGGPIVQSRWNSFSIKHY